MLKYTFTRYILRQRIRPAILHNVNGVMGDSSYRHVRLSSVSWNSLNLAAIDYLTLYRNCSFECISRSPRKQSSSELVYWVRKRDSCILCDAKYQMDKFIAASLILLSLFSL